MLGCKLGEFLYKKNGSYDHKSERNKKKQEKLEKKQGKKKIMGQAVNSVSFYRLGSLFKWHASWVIVKKPYIEKFYKKIF